MGVHLAKALEAADFHLGARIPCPELGGNALPFRFVIGDPCGLAPGELKEGRHGGIDIALLNEGAHKAEEEGQKQCPDMASVHVGIRHNDDFMIPELIGVELLPDARPQGGDDGLELVVSIDLVRPGLFHIQHLSPKGQDGLEAGVPPLGGGASGGVALDDIELSQLRVILVAVPELVGHGGAAQGRLAADGFPGLLGGLPGPGGGEGLVQNHPSHLGVFLQEGVQLLRHDVVYQSADFAVTQLGLGLALKLGVGELHGDDAGEALPAVLAGDLLVVLEHLDFFAVAVQHGGQCPLEALLVHAPLRGVDVVGEGEDGFAVAVVVL